MALTVLTRSLILYASVISSNKVTNQLLKEFSCHWSVTGRSLILVFMRSNVTEHITLFQPKSLCSIRSHLAVSINIPNYNSVIDLVVRISANCCLRIWFWVWLSILELNLLLFCLWEASVCMCVCTWTLWQSVPISDSAWGVGIFNSLKSARMPDIWRIVYTALFG